MKVGNLRHCVTIQAPAETVDEYGEPIPSWVDVATGKAEVRTPTGREKVNADQLKVQLSHVVTMRWRLLPDGSEIDPTKQLVFRGRVLRITHPINVNERNVELVLYCVEQVNEAGVTP